jgi:hypothetical protein
MANECIVPSPERAAILQWTARIGAVTAEALAHRHEISVASARARLRAAERAQLVVRRRPLAGQPALYTVTRAGMRASGLNGLDPCRVSASNAQHAIECARAAAALERCYPDHRVLGERELRAEERHSGAPLASVRMDPASYRGQQLHRPDLVLWPRGAGLGLPVPVEVELTVKAPQRLANICRSWARCRSVAGVLYLAAPEVEAALRRAIEKADASERVVVVPLDALPGLDRAAESSIARTVPGDA